MECKQCGIDRPEKDFLGKETCYKCQYEKKMKGKHKNRCRQCRKFLSASRWIYCSDECSKEGEKKLKKDYWTNLL